MRTKTLLLAAAFGAMGIASSLAQVYSVNAVGYINLTLAPGFTMIANQLDNKAGNKVGDVLKVVPDGAVLYKFDSNTGTYVINSFDVDAWSDPNMTMNPGEGAFINLPSAATVTLVGEVPQGTALAVALPKGFSIASSIVPQTADLSVQAIGFPAGDGDVVYRWNTTTKSYDIYSFDVDAWSPAAPALAVGESFFVNKLAAASWTRSFSVNP